MQHLIVLTTLPYYELVLDRIRDTVAASSIITVTVSNYMQFESKLQSRPFFSGHYEVIVHLAKNSEMQRTILEWGKIKWVRLVILAPYKAAYIGAQTILDEAKLDYALFNCYQVGFFYKVHYIREKMLRLSDGNLRLDQRIASYIARRIGGNENRLDFILAQILELDKITVYTVGKLLPKVHKVTLGNFMFKLFGEQEFPMGDLVSLIERYRHYVISLIREIDTFLEQWGKLYNEYISGQLSDLNYLTWLEERGQDFEVASKYQLEQWLYIFRTYSYDVYFELCRRVHDFHRQDYYLGYADAVYFLRFCLVITRKQHFMDEYIAELDRNEREGIGKNREAVIARKSELKAGGSIE